MPISWVSISPAAALQTLKLFRTGTKCLPKSALRSCHGTVLHDCHGEVIALRGFNRWVLNELEHILSNSVYHSPYIETSSVSSQGDLAEDASPLKYVFKDDVSFHFFSTEAPCGDASMELLIRSKPPGDALPWRDVSCGSTEASASLLLGRGYFSQLGAVRRKPARGDAEATMSKSCTDKLALKQCSGLLSFPADIVVTITPNCFIKSFVIFQDQYDRTGYERAFGSKGRPQSSSDGSQCFDFSILPHSFPPFEFEKGSPTAPTKTSNVSALWIRGSGISPNDSIEVLINGVKQGFKQFEEREGKESTICRKQMWCLGARIQALLAAKHQSRATDPKTDLQLASSYRVAKDHVARLARRQLKVRVAQTQAGWIPNTGDEEWALG